MKSQIKFTISGMLLLLLLLDDLLAERGGKLHPLGRRAHETDYFSNAMVCATATATKTHHNVRASSWAALLPITFAAESLAVMPYLLALGKSKHNNNNSNLTADQQAQDACTYAEMPVVPSAEVRIEVAKVNQREMSSMML